jgi:hypothetical protein
MITFAFLVTFYKTVKNKKIDDEKAYQDDRANKNPISPHNHSSPPTYGALLGKPIARKDSQDQNVVTYCMIDGRLIDREGPIPTNRISILGRSI